MSSTQINFRIPAQLKLHAQKKAERLGMNLSEVMKLFLEKFAIEDVFKISVKHNIKWEKIFDQGVESYFMSKKGKKTTQAINDLLSEIK